MPLGQPIDGSEGMRQYVSDISDASEFGSEVSGQ